MNLTSCKIKKIIYPDLVSPGDTFVLNLEIVDSDVPENNEHYGLIGLAIPENWIIEESQYSFELGSGILQIDEDWRDSLIAVYPESSFGRGYKWVALTSNEKYSYKEVINIEANIKIKTDDKEGFYNFGVLVTKASPNMISSEHFNWSPLMYPNSITVSNSNANQDIFTVESAPEWDSLFDRSSGWTGADGIYSIPLNEKETYNNSGDHLLLFSDTFVGDVDSNNKRINTNLVNNTLAKLNSSKPENDSINFIYDKNKAIFVPSTPEANSGDWYWLMDGLKIGDHIYTYGLRLEKQLDGVFGFNTVGTNLIKYKISNNSEITDIEQFDTPLFYVDPIRKSKITLGQAVMPLTYDSENYVKDDYIYIYGPKDDNGKQLVCSRVKKDDIEDFAKYEYWSGNDWGNDISECYPITNKISQEFSVSPLPNGKFIIVFQVGDYIAYRIGESPVGPFGMFNIVYDCPEINISKDVFVYNAKAHPSLSTDDGILISYNVNTFSLSENFLNADIYRPRFIKLSINDFNISAASDELRLIGESYILHQNYPNPFNPITNIQFTINENDSYSLIVYDSLGKETELLFKNKFYNIGYYNISWDASSLSSGVYYYELRNSTKRITKKMVLIK